MELRQKYTLHVILELGDHENDHTSEDNVKNAEILLQLGSAKSIVLYQNSNDKAYLEVLSLAKLVGRL